MVPFSALINALIAGVPGASFRKCAYYTQALGFFLSSRMQYLNFSIVVMLDKNLVQVKKSCTIRFAGEPIEISSQLEII